MIDKIRNSTELQDFIKNKCIETGGNRVSEIKINSLIKSNSLAIIKIDDYYNSLKSGKSIDCLIILKNGSKYKLFLLELKEPKRKANFRYLKSKDIKEKFTTTIYDFMSTRFKNIFLSSDYDIEDFFIVLFIH